MFSASTSQGNTVEGLEPSTLPLKVNAGADFKGVDTQRVLTSLELDGVITDSTGIVKEKICY